MYENGDYKDLADKINSLLNNNEYYEEIQENIYEFAEEVLWSKRGEKILNFIINSN